MNVHTKKTSWKLLGVSHEQAGDMLVVSSINARARRWQKVKQREVLLQLYIF